MANEDQFSLQYAIQMPDGSYAKASPREQHPLLWSDRGLAEEYMRQLQQAAMSIGITHWTGRVCYQYCTPFVSDGDDAKQLVGELEAWMRNRGDL